MSKPYILYASALLLLLEGCFKLLGKNTIFYSSVNLVILSLAIIVLVLTYAKANMQHTNKNIAFLLVTFLLSVNWIVIAVYIFL